MSNVTISIPVPHSVLLDILTTAVEGGCAYWLQAEAVERDDNSNVTKIVGPSSVDGDVFEFQPGFRLEDITADTVLRGLKLLADGALPGRDDLRKNILGIASNRHDFDADDADVIVQLGFFGDTVYG